MSQPSKYIHNYDMDLHQRDFARAHATITHDASGRAQAAFGKHQLSSHFQPIISLSHQRVIGFEGLLRAHDDSGLPVSPLTLLARAEQEGELVLLDRIARLLHVINRPTDQNHWLFLNVHPEVFIEAIAQSNFMNDLLAHQQMAPTDVVIEVLEDTIRDEARFAETVARLRADGFLIALDDFGAGHSNFDRVWKIQPEIVKLDRSFAVRMEHDAGARRLMPRIVSLLHEAGSMVLLEGIETRTQAHIALDADIDFVQGYYFGRPEAFPAVDMDVQDNVADLWRDFTSRAATADIAHRDLIAPYQNALDYASVLLAAGRDLTEACAGFLALPLTNFCYLLDRDGRQSSANLWSKRAKAEATGPRFRPLANASDARWSRRPYFRRALRQLNRIQVTRPYLSASTADLCITLSVGFLHAGEPCVLCGDVAWTG